MGEATQEATGTQVTVRLDGGDLSVEIGAGLHVDLTGWARPVFAGRLSDELVQELRHTNEAPTKEPA